MKCFEKLVAIKCVGFHHTSLWQDKPQCLYVSQMGLSADEKKAPCACFYSKPTCPTVFSCLFAKHHVLIELRNSIVLCFRVWFWQTWGMRWCDNVDLSVTAQWNQAGQGHSDTDPGGIDLTAVSRNHSFLVFCCCKPQNEFVLRNWWCANMELRVTKQWNQTGKSDSDTDPGRNWWCANVELRVPEKVPEKVWEALVQSQVRFNMICGQLIHGNPAEVFRALCFAARSRKICKNKTLRLLGIPPKLIFLKLTTSKTKQFCETSFKNGKLSAELTASYHCVLRFFQSICLEPSRGKSNSDTALEGIDLTTVSQNHSFLVFCCCKPQNALFWETDDAPTWSWE